MIICPADLKSSVTLSSTRLDLPGRRTQFHLANLLSELQGAQRLAHIALQSRYLQWNNLSIRFDVKGVFIYFLYLTEDLTCTTMTVLLPFPRESCNKYVSREFLKGM